MWWIRRAGWPVMTLMARTMMMFMMRYNWMRAGSDRWCSRSRGSYCCS